MGVGREALDKLAVYYAALEDHVAHPMFKVKNGDASVGSEIWRLRGMSAVALDYLVGLKSRCQLPRNGWPAFPASRGC